MISVTILSKNSALYLYRVLQGLSNFDEVILYDTGSTDETCNIAAEFENVRVIHGSFIGFGATHNNASSHTSHNWVLSIDSDEIVTPSLVSEIFALNLDSACVYSIARDNYYRGKHIKGCGWYPDRVVRLYDKTKTQFSDDLVHEKIIVDNVRTVVLENPIFHYPYNSIDDFLRKMQSYTTLFADQYYNKKKATFCTAICHSLAAFIKSYFLKRGFLLGTEGIEISIYNAICAYYKYLKLRDKNEKTRL